MYRKPLRRLNERLILRALLRYKSGGGNRTTTTTARRPGWPISSFIYFFFSLSPFCWAPTWREGDATMQAVDDHLFIFLLLGPFLD